MRAPRPIAAELEAADPVSAEYVARRRAIEAQHDQNDDGTEWLYVRQFGTGHDYDEGRKPLQDSDDPSRLTEFGLIERDYCRVAEHCGTIGEVRRAVAAHAVQSWRQSGPVCEQHVVAALKKADRVK